MSVFSKIRCQYISQKPRGGGGGVLHYGLDGDVRQFWVVFGLKTLGLG